MAAGRAGVGDAEPRAALGGSDREVVAVLPGPATARHDDDARAIRSAGAAGAAAAADDVAVGSDVRTRPPLRPAQPGAPANAAGAASPRPAAVDSERDANNSAAHPVRAGGAGLAARVRPVAGGAIEDARSAAEPVHTGRA